jgi:LacI family transcriptional regulator
MDAPDTPPPSLSKIARRAGVAKSTVSMALRNDPLISERQRKRIRKMATGMGWRPQPHVAQLMSQLSLLRNRQCKATLAMVSAVEADPKTIPPSSAAAGWLAGAEARARQLGYGLDHFWLHDPEISAERLAKILWARNVQGVVLHSLDSTTCLPLAKRGSAWRQFPIVTIGSRMQMFPLNFVCADYHATAMQGCRQLLSSGYRRIGLYMVRWLDNKWEHRLVGGYRTCMEEWELDMPPVFFVNCPRNQPADESVQAAFKRWLTEQRLDACLGVTSYVLDRILMAGLQVPGDIGVAVLDLPGELRGRVAGMEQQHMNAGMAAIDALVSQILRQEAGIPPFQQGIMIGSSWVPGPTVRAVTPTAVRKREDVGRLRNA